MAARSKHRRVLSALASRAHNLLGGSATPLDYVLYWVEKRRFLSRLAEDLAREMGEPLSRTFLSHVAQRLTPDARQQIAVARHAVRSRSAAKPSVAGID
jgi:hypothetical protein